MSQYIVKSGGGIEIMPALDGIIGYFDISSVDLENKIWYNQKDNTNNIPFTDGSIVDAGFQTVGANIDDFNYSVQPKILYIICKKDEHDDDNCILSVGKKTSNNNSGFTLWQSEAAIYELSQTGSPYIHLPSGDITQYNLLIMASYSAIDTAKDNGIMLFYNGQMVGFLSNHIFNNYNGKIGILKELQGSSIYSPIVKPTCIKMMAFGIEEQTPEQIIENSKFLMNKYMS